MNKIKLWGSLIVVALFLSTNTFAQTAENRTWLTTYIGVNEVNSDNFNEHLGFRWGNDLGGGLGLRYYLNNNFDAELGVFISRVDDEIRWTADYYNTNLLFHYKLANGNLLSENSAIRPFLTAGAGFSLYRDGNVPETEGLEIPLGAGIDIPLGKRISLTTNVLYNFTFNDDIDGDRVKSFRTPDDSPDNLIQYKAGFKINLGPLDKDGDGVTNRMDMCPATPGDPAFDGCPDSDGDMVPDYKDQCPNIAGTEATNGCPDMDGDGIIDSEDRCANIAGSAEFGGCPDSDGDGIIDSNDQCPNVAGSEGMNGCPDSDNDGIADNNDQCPNVAGDAATGGCPDSDNDGVIDSEDECPNVAGESDFEGCPGIDRANELADAVNNELRFGFDDASIKSEYNESLNKLGDFLANYDVFNIVIAGYTDSIGSAEYNERLAFRRAEAVKSYLVERGVSASMITTSAIGKDDPVATNETEEGRQQNRRVMITVTLSE